MEPITQKDLEAISAYLDQALDPGDRARLEDRLQNEPQLRAEFDSLQQTRRRLRGAPQLRAPRNFTLTPEMVGKATPRRLYPVARLAFVLASVTFVFALVGNYTFGAAISPAAERETAYSLADEATLAEPAPTPPGEPVAGDAAGGETIEESPAEEQIDGAGPDSAETQPPVATQESVPSLAPPTEEAMAVVGEGASDQADDRAAAGPTEPVEGGSEVMKTTEAGPPAQPDAAAGAERGSAEAEPASANMWLIVMAAAGALVLLSGVLLLVLRRR